MASGDYTKRCCENLPNSLRQECRIHTIMEVTSTSPENKRNRVKNTKIYAPSKFLISK